MNYLIHPPPQERTFRLLDWKRTVSAGLMHRLFWGVFWILSFSSAGNALDKKGWQLQLGASATNLNRRWSVPNEFSSKVSQVQGLVGIEKKMELNKKLSFRPEFFTLVPWRKGFDGRTVTFTSQLGLKLAYEVSKWFQLNLGPGVFWESSLSLGDSVNLGNGTSSSSFYTPARWTQVILFTAYGGIDFQLSRNLSFHLAVIVPEAADPLKRRFHGLVKLGVAL